MLTWYLVFGFLTLVDLPFGVDSFKNSSCVIDVGDAIDELAGELGSDSCFPLWKS